MFVLLYGSFHYKWSNFSNLPHLLPGIRFKLAYEFIRTPNGQGQNISSMSAIISNLQALYFYPRVIEKPLKICWVSKKHLLVHCLPLSNNIDMSCIFLNENFKNHDNFCLRRTVFSQS